MVIKCKHYAFTIFVGKLNGKFSSVEEWFEFAKDRTNGVKYLVMQRELAPTTGELHIQGFLSWQTQKTPATTANHFGGVIPECFQKMTKGSTPWANKVYCTKEESRVPGTLPFEYGELPLPNGKEDPDKSKLDTFIEIMKHKSLHEAIEEMPSTFVRNCNGLAKLDQIYSAARIPWVRPVDVFVCYGPPGSGKSWFAQSWDVPDHTFAVPDIRHKERLNLDGYAGQRTLLIEDYDGAIEFRSLLRMLDVYKAQFNTKGATVWSAWETVIITSNVYPGRWYDDQCDPWGLQDQSPLRRRITRMLEFKGKWPSSTVSVDGGEFVDVSILNNRVECQAMALESSSASGAVPGPTSADASTTGLAAPASSAQSVPNGPCQRDLSEFGFYDKTVAQDIDGLTAEDLLDEWELKDREEQAALEELKQQYEHVANDFITHALDKRDLSPLVFEYNAEAEAELLNGEAGDGEPDNGKPL